MQFPIALLQNYVAMRSELALHIGQ